MKRHAECHDSSAADRRDVPRRSGMGNGQLTMDNGQLTTEK
jgi:hypothetical protein